MTKRNAGTIHIDLFSKMSLLDSHKPGICQCLHGKCFLYFNEVNLVYRDSRFFERIAHG